MIWDDWDEFLRNGWLPLLGKRDVADRLFGSLQVDSSKARRKIKK